MRIGKINQTGRKRIPRSDISIEKEVKKIELNEENFLKFIPLLKLYDRADIINELV